MDDLKLARRPASKTAPLRKPSRVLVVEDDATTLMFLEQQLRGLGYEAIGTVDGESACKALEDDHDIADVVLLDRILPGIQGPDVVRRLRATPALRAKPIVMVTGCDEAEQVKEGVDAGVFYYLVKPVDAAVLQSVLAAAMRRAESNQVLLREVQARRSGISCMETARFRFRTVDEALDIAVLISGCFPEPDRAAIGLSELLVNAVEHGNLEIGFDLKGQLLEAGTLNDEIEARLNQPQYADRTAEAVVTRKANGTYVVITDQGKGFDPKPFLVLDPERASRKHGRGLAQAKATSFDKLGFNDVGNKVVAFVAHETALEW